MGLQFLNNRYWILRHGKSIPNEIGIVISSPENGVLPKYGLAVEGISQAQEAGKAFLKELQENNICLEDVRICYSPFSRTKETARVVSSTLNLLFEGPQCKMVEDLRERFFGPTFEHLTHEKYAEIWALDEKDPFKSPEGGESVADVVSRLAIALTNMESEFQGCAVLIVSHGDPLQILQTVFHSVKESNDLVTQDLLTRIRDISHPSILSKHRNFALQTAELRKIT